MTRQPIIGPGMRVKLNFTIKLASGEIVDSTNGKAAEFVVGDGNLLPGFETAMFGMSSGDQRELEISPVAGFGEPNPENFKDMDCGDFPADVELQQGLVVYFTDVNGNELPGIVQQLKGDSVTVDFNHPLAGRDLLFDVEIIEVERVSNEIIRVSE